MKIFNYLFFALILSFLGYSQVASAANNPACSGLPVCGSMIPCSAKCCGQYGPSYGSYCVLGTVCNPAIHLCQRR
jgi:hypothetical protein